MYTVSELINNALYLSDFLYNRRNEVFIDARVFITLKVAKVGKTTIAALIKEALDKEGISG